MTEDDDGQNDLPVPVEAPWRDPENGRFRSTPQTEGDPRWPGRPRGSLNKTTVAMRSAIAAVFEDLQERHGGEGRYPHFLAWAEANPTEFYRIAARQMPVPFETAGRTIGVLVFKGVNDGGDDD